MMPLQQGARRLRLSDLLGGAARTPSDSGAAIRPVDLPSRRHHAGGLFLACCSAANPGFPFVPCTGNPVSTTRKAREFRRHVEDPKICYGAGAPGVLREGGGSGK